MPSKSKNYFLIPENLNIENLIQNLDPAPYMRKGRKFTITKLLTVIDKLYHLMSNPKSNEFSKDNFIPVKMEYIRKYVSDAENYIKYLIESKVLLTDSRYIIGYKSKAYRFNDSYLGTPVVFDIQIKEEELEYINLVGFDSKAKKLTHLRKWYNNKLTIDVAKALKESYATYWQRDGEELPIYYDDIDFNSVSKIGINRRSLEFTSKEHEKQFRGLLGGLVIPLATYENKEFTFKVDESGYRLHTNITNMKKTIRKHVKYEGKSIVSFDIKNSQPFFLNVVATETFWQLKHNTTHRFNISHLERPSKQLRNIYRKFTKAPLTMRTFNETQYRTTFELFKKVTLDGSLYEFIKNKHVELTGEVLERDKVKKQLITLLYDRARIHRNYDYNIEDTIETVLPGLLTFCNMFKTKYEYNGLALLLQNVESTVILRIVTSKIAERYPDMPLFTIHDSIATTVDYAPILGPLVTSEIEQCVGLKPTIKEEIWA